MAQAQCYLSLAFLREQANPTMQEEDTVLCTMLLGTGDRQQIGIIRDKTDDQCKQPSV